MKRLKQIHGVPTRRLRIAFAAVAVVVLGGCASLSPDAGLSDVQALVAGKTGPVDARFVNR